MRCPAAPKYCRATPLSSGGSTHSRSMTRRISSSLDFLDQAPTRPAKGRETTLAVLEVPRRKEMLRRVEESGGYQRRDVPGPASRLLFNALARSVPDT